MGLAMSAHCSKCRKVTECVAKGIAMFCVVCSAFIGYVEDVVLVQPKDDRPASVQGELPARYQVEAIEASASASASPSPAADFEDIEWS